MSARDIEAKGREFDAKMKIEELRVNHIVNAMQLRSRLERASRIEATQQRRPVKRESL